MSNIKINKNTISDLDIREYRKSKGLKLPCWCYENFELVQKKYNYNKVASAPCK
jgi:hypothetical protein